MSPLDRMEARRRLSEARVARLATADGGGVPHVVPIVFATDGDTIYWTVDRKPKRTPEIKRLANIRANPNVEVIVDRYEERWDRIWWIRAAGPARVVESDEEAGRALGLLAEKYPQYRTNPPPGPVVAVQVARLTWWEGGPAPAAS